MKKKKTIFAIIDVETTGGTAAKERITEIAIALHDGEKVIDTYSTLLNPERSIPYNITQLTGISNEMVQNAPKFFEVAKKIVEMTEGAIFVAHNVRFDYNFIREEFARLGFSYVRKQLCTVKMSRQALPGLSSYSLGNLIKSLNIKVLDRHRALADVLATVEVFERIIAVEKGVGKLEDRVNLGIKETNLPNGISLEKLNSLPEECGVYYYYDKQGEVIYVGKSINIRLRAMQHFSDHTEKTTKMLNGVYDITYEITGSELIALLLENHEIKRMKPRLNKAQKAKNFAYAVFHYKNEQGFICFKSSKNVSTVRSKMKLASEFQKLPDAKGRLRSLTQRFELCSKMTDLETSEGACFAYQINQCLGACCGEESVETYNERASAALETLEIVFEKDFFILEKGRNLQETAVVLVEDNKFKGMGYLDNDVAATTEDLYECIQKYPSNADSLRIVRQHLTGGKQIKIVNI